MASSLEDWKTLGAAAGEPAPRVFSAESRLFEQHAPVVRLWHDNSGWCPFCAQVWAVIEDMQLPYESRTIPLSSYLRPCERKPAEFLSLCPDGLVPAIQLNKAQCGVEFGPALESGRQPGVGAGVEICQELFRLFPDKALLPQPAAWRAFAEALMQQCSEFEAAVLPFRGGPGNEARFVAALDMMEAAYGGERQSQFERSRWIRDSSKDQRYSVEPGPFLFGQRPCVVDYLLLPVLERMEAYVPHPGLGNSQHLSLTRWPKLAGLLAAGRVPGQSAFAHICSDAETLLGIAFRGREPQLQKRFSRDTDRPSLDELASATPACRDAAARLCSNHAAIARFVARGHGVGPNEKVAVDVVDDALRAVAASLLNESSPRLGVASAAAALQAAHGTAASRAASGALRFLARNTGVPRDMDAATAKAFRTHLLLFADSCEKLQEGRL